VLPLLVERGAHATTREIAQAAGVSEGTLFNVFGDKDELIAAVVDAAIDQEPFERAVREIDTGLAFEHRLVVATELIRRRIVDIWRLVSQVGPKHGMSDHRPLPASPALAAMFEAAPVRLTLEPQRAALHLRALTLALTHPVLAAEPWPAERIVEVFLHGVEVPS
jgi:AcrR family transcriptional regulator